MSDGVTVVSAYETGLVTMDGLRHAVRRRLTGRFAICGAGRAVVLLATSFRAVDPDACPDCATQVAAG